MRNQSDKGVAGFPDPYDDPFYKVPKNINSFRNGTIINRRSVITTITNNVKESFQLLYRTTTTQNKASATVATVWKPSKPKSPAVVLSYHVYMDSDALDCDPSWAFVAGSDSKATGTTSQDTAIFIQWALDNGIYVVVPDDEGVNATFVAGIEEGRAALDGMRAIRNFYKLPQKTGFAISGYSGGGHVTAWTANLAGVYAPDLNVLGAVHGGTPVDPRQDFNFLNKGPFADFAGAALVGLMGAYPDLNKFVLANTNQAGKDYVTKYRSRNFCQSNVSTSAPLVDFLSFFTVPDPLNQPIVKAVLANESLLMDVSTPNPVYVPKFPRYQWPGLEDEILPYLGEKQFINQQCSKGANIQFQTFPAAEHITAEFEGIHQAIVFLNQLFSGTTPKVICGTPAPNPASLSDPATIAILGPNTIATLQKYNGLTFNGKTIKFS